MNGGVAMSEGRSWLADVRSLGTFGRAWAIGIILFSAARALIAWPTLGRYGVNPWVFLAVDIVTAPPYGVAQAVTVMVLRDRNRPQRDAWGWALVVIVMFLAPYGYILVSSGELPLLAYLGVGAWMALFGVLAVVRMRRQVHSPN